MKKYALATALAFCLAVFIEIVFQANPFLRLTGLSILSLAVLLYALYSLGKQWGTLLITLLVFAGLMLLGYYQSDSLYTWNPLIIAAAGFATIVKAAVKGGDATR